MNSKDISQIEEAFKELQTYSDEQFRTINDLKKQIIKLKEENASLKKNGGGGIAPIVQGDSGISNEQLVCETQIYMLKERAAIQELTLEEAKKFQIYTQVLKDLKAKNPVAGEFDVKKLSDTELLALADLEHNGNASSLVDEAVKEDLPKNLYDAKQ